MSEIQEQQQKEIGITDIFKILLQKIRLLVVVLVIGALLGGLFGFFKYKNDKYYGAEVKYEISIRASTTFYENGVKTGDPVADISPNYIYKEEHISMLLDHLNSDTFHVELLKDFVPDVVNAVLVDGEVNLDGETVTEDAKEEFLSYMKLVATSITYSSDYDTNPNAFSMTVSVKNDEALAKTLLATAKKLVPQEVSGTRDADGNIVRKGSIIVPASTTSYDGSKSAVTSYAAECNSMSYTRSHRLNAGYATKKAILFAAIFGLGALIVACVIVILVENADEKLRDYEAVSKSLGIPVLGVIPAIDKVTEYRYGKKYHHGGEKE